MNAAPTIEGKGRSGQRSGGGSLRLVINSFQERLHSAPYRNPVVFPATMAAGRQVGTILRSDLPLSFTYPHLVNSFGLSGGSVVSKQDEETTKGKQSVGKSKQKFVKKQQRQETHV